MCPEIMHISLYKYNHNKEICQIEGKFDFWWPHINCPRDMIWIHVNGTGPTIQSIWILTNIWIHVNGTNMWTVWVYFWSTKIDLKIFLIFNFWEKLFLESHEMRKSLKTVPDTYFDHIFVSFPFFPFLEYFWNILFQIVEKYQTIKLSSLLTILLGKN